MHRTRVAVSSPTRSVPTVPKSSTTSRIFCKSKPQGRIDRAIITVIDPQTAIHTGICTFTLTEDGQPQNLQARCTFAYQKQNGNWLIVNHHQGSGVVD